MNNKVWKILVTLLVVIQSPVLFAANTSSSSQAKINKSVYLVRHAEKQSNVGKDPALTERGKIRANNVAAMLKNKNITEIYSTDYQRTQQTAAPLAKLLNLKVKSYDPRALKEFADKIKTENKNILIVGHSNTTPMLSFLLGGEAKGEIDDSEYTRLYQLNYSAGKVKTTLQRTKPDSKRARKSHVIFKAKQFKDTELKFAMSFNGQVVGESVQKLYKRDGQFVMKEKTIIEKMGIDADIEVKVDADSLAPISMSMSGTMGAPSDIQLQWQGSKVIGHSLMPRAPYKRQGKMSVEQDFPKQNVERTSAIMMAHLMDVSKEHGFSIDWFDAYSAETKSVEISYQGEESVTVPAGTFDTYKVQYLGGAPSQLFYIAKGDSPKVVKIEVISMPWVYELLE